MRDDSFGLPILSLVLAVGCTKNPQSTTSASFNRSGNPANTGSFEPNGDFNGSRGPRHSRMRDNNWPRDFDLNFLKAAVGLPMATTKADIKTASGASNDANSFTIILELRQKNLLPQESDSNAAP